MPGTTSASCPERANKHFPGHRMPSPLPHAEPLVACGGLTAFSWECSAGRDRDSGCAVLLCMFQCLSPAQLLPPPPAPPWPADMEA